MHVVQVCKQLPPTSLISTSNNKVTMLNTLVWGPQCVIKSKLSHYLEITHRTTDSISCISIVCYQSVLKTKKAILHTVGNDIANYPSGFDHDDTRRGHMIEPKWCISGPISQAYQYQWIRPTTRETFFGAYYNAQKDAWGTRRISADMSILDFFTPHNWPKNYSLGLSQLT